GALEEAHRRLMEANQRVLDERERALQAEKLSSIGQLAAGVAHEIANPLTGVMACARALRSGSVAEHKRGDYLETITDGLERIQATVRSLLDYASPQTSETAPVDAAELISASARLLAPKLERAGVKIDVGIGRG